jgi:DNA-directed RNA polymerase subunit alpha
MIERTYVAAMLALPGEKKLGNSRVPVRNFGQVAILAGEIWANWSGPPPAQAAAPERAHFKFLLMGGSPMTRIPLPKIDTQATDLSARLEMSTAEIGLSVRTTNCLEERGIFTVDHLLHCTREDLLSISNFGEKTLEEVYKALEGVGFYRRGKREPVSA